MPVGLSGNLVDFGIADVFQLIGQQRKTGVLELRNGEVRAQLVFWNGMVVTAAPAVSRAGDIDPVADRLVRCGLLPRERAGEAMTLCKASAQTLPRVLVDRGWLDTATVREAEELVTRDTIFEVLRWHEGSFDFRASEVNPDRSPTDMLGAEQILMDGLRMVDEWQSHRALVPSESAVYTRTGSFERFLESQPHIGADERQCAERVFALVDGKKSARRIIDLARLGTFDGVRCLADLHQGGAIRALSSGETASLPSLPEVGVDRAALLRAAVSAGVPLLILAAAVVWATAPTPVGPEAPAGVAIHRASFEDLAHDYVARAARRAVEAYRLEHGRWPRDLDEVERAGLLPEGWLAGTEGRPYYSLHHELGPLLLAPEVSLAAVPPRGSP